MMLSHNELVVGRAEDVPYDSSVASSASTYAKPPSQHRASAGPRRRHRLADSR